MDNDWRDKYLRYHPEMVCNIIGEFFWFSFFEKSTKTEIHWYSIPNFDGASWVTSSISSFRVSKPSHWCLEESALPKKITSTAAVSFYRKTPKNLHIRYSRIQMCIGYCTLVAIWQCYSLMNWETVQRDLCWEMPDWVNRPKIQICCFYLFQAFPGSFKNQDIKRVY